MSIFPSQVWRLIVKYKIGTWFHSAPNLRAGVKMKWTLQPAVPSCFWHIQQKQTKTNRISRFDRENGRFRQVPPHMLALVAQLLSNAKFSHCNAQNRFWHFFTTPLRSIKYLHVPLELRDFALFGGLETWSIPIRLDWRKSFSCWTAAFWTAAFKVWGKMKRCKVRAFRSLKMRKAWNLNLLKTRLDVNFSFTRVKTDR